MISPPPAASVLARPRPIGSPQGRARTAAPGYGLGFVLFLVVNATLFVRPAEIVPALLGLEIYLVLILACFAVSFPAVLEQLTGRALESRPVTVCVLGFVLTVVVSHLARLQLPEAGENGLEMFKVVVYYLLCISLVNTPARLRQFLFWLVIFSVVVTTLAILEYHGAIHLPNLKTLKALEKDQATGKDVVIRRLQGTGIFQDPNDLCSLLVVALLVCCYWLTDRRSGVLRLAWVVPFLLFGYALALTQSRGGFLAVLVGLLIFFRARFGWAMTVLLGALVVPMLFVLLAGRQTSLSTAATTGRERIQIWSDGLVLFRGSPLFGIGKDKYGVEVGHVAHNSFLQAFTELGFFGGMLFLGAFTFVLGSLKRLGDARERIIDPELRRMQPYLMGAVAGYAAIMLTLTLCYNLPTFTILGLATVYISMAVCHPPLPAARFDLRLLVRMGLASVGFLAGLYLFVRFFFVA
jgi:O-antigen ligase